MRKIAVIAAVMVIVLAALSQGVGAANGSLPPMKKYVTCQAGFVLYMPSGMMQSAYDERQKSTDYRDYQRSNYIRGQSDWVSSMEGGAVYHSDSWGTKNTTTGEYYEGQPYNYVNFSGRNPKYNEQMQEINSRALYETHRR